MNIFPSDTNDDLTDDSCGYWPTGPVGIDNKK